MAKPPYAGARPKICLDPGEFGGDPNWKIDDILTEFIAGFRFLLPLKKEVTVFGSARLPTSSRWYKEATKLGVLLAEDGYTVITGGGPGIMEAANHGAHDTCLKEHRECSIGIDIVLPEGERRNPFVDRRIAFHYFFTRKVMLRASAQAYIFFPGGYGTLDEFLETLALVQTKKMERVPIACVGKAYWGPLRAWMTRQMLEGETPMIDAGDLDLFQIVDTAEEALEVVRTSKERKFF